MAHFRVLAGRSTLPAIVYKSPARAQGVSTGELDELLSNPNVAGLRNTSPDYFQLARLIRDRADEMCLAGLAIGAKGATGTAYDVVGNLFVDDPLAWHIEGRHLGTEGLVHAWLQEESFGDLFGSDPALATMAFPQIQERGGNRAHGKHAGTRVDLRNRDGSGSIRRVEMIRLVMRETGRREHHTHY